MNSAPAAAQISIRFTGWWTAGTGASGASGADSICARENGLPVLPMTQVKGRLRDTARIFWGEEAATSWFGAESGSGGGGLLRFAGNARIAGGHKIAHQHGLFTTLGLTALADGVACDETLREVEVALPCTLSAVVEPSDERTKELPLDWVDQLDALCALTVGFGKFVNDGFGRAIAQATEVVSHQRSKLQLADTDFSLILTPRDPAVFSSRAATQGKHATLEGPAGGNLWGWAIARANAVGNNALVTALLSGKVRFSDAVPLAADGKPTFLRPAVLVTAKHKEGAPLYVGRTALAQGDPDAQAEAIGRIWLTADLGNSRTGATRYRLRTAMKDGRALKGQLFGYEEIGCGGRRYKVDIDASALDEELQGDFLALFDGRPLVLGKARNSGYGGGYDVEAGMEPAYPALAKVAADARVARIWCLSDMALLDVWGRLIVRPHPGEFGLDDSWRFSTEESVVSVRRYAPWDRAAGSRTSEIAAVEAGSVFSFTRSGQGNGDLEVTLSPRGAHTHRGLGRWSIVPDTRDPLHIKQIEESVSVSKDAHEVEAALLERTEAIAREASGADLTKWLEGVRTAPFPSGPSRSQWSLVGALNRKSKTLNALQATLDGPKPLDDKAWTEKNAAWKKRLQQWLSQLDALKCSEAQRLFAVDQLVKIARAGKRG